MRNEIKENPAQERVAREIYGQMIVVACPGSGKTTTLLRRIHNMVENDGINPEEILMITFTKAAAAEMEERYNTQYGKNSGVTFCTIHALCTKFLQKFADLDPETILSDNYSMIADIVKEDERSWEINNIDQLIKELVTDITSVKNNNKDLDSYTPKSPIDSGFFFDLYQKYEDEKKSRGAIDYDDLLIMTYNIMQHNKESLKYIRNQYRFIHVDEYQDTSFLQRDIIYAAAGLNGNIAVVGDDDQSIYGFRGAKPEVMQDFLKHYPSAKEVHMGINYRSDRDIISAASCLIEHNKSRFEKNIQSFSERNGSVTVKTAGMQKDMYMYACADIMKLIRDGESPSNIAVLFRTNSQICAMMDILIKYDVPFYGNEELPDRYKDDMFYDIMAYWNMAFNESSASKEDFIRTVTHPDRSFANAGRMGFNDAMQNTDETNARKYQQFLALLRLLGKKPDKALDLIYHQGGYMKYMQHYAEKIGVSFNEMKGRWDSYKDDIIRNNIQSFGEWKQYTEGFSTLLQKRQENHDGVCLSTMHKSKGLEWDHVFILNCMEGSIPFSKAKKESEVEEERRLFYVAMTRAKHDLRLYCYSPNKEKIYAKPTRFIAEFQNAV